MKYRGSCIPWPSFIEYPAPAAHQFRRKHTCRFSFAGAHTLLISILSVRSPIGSRLPPTQRWRCTTFLIIGAESAFSLCLPYLNTSFRNLRLAVHRGCRKEPLTDWRPWLLFSPHLTALPAFHSGAPTPFLPYQRHRPQSSFLHR